MAAVMLLVIPAFMESIQKTALSFLQIHTEITLWANGTGLPTDNAEVCLLPIADFTFSCRVILKSC